jgi:hypothetical protein
MNDTVKVFLDELDNRKVKINFTLQTKWLSNNEVFLDYLDDCFGLDYLAAKKFDNEETTSIIIETEKGKALTYLNTMKDTFINKDELRRMLGICLLENRDN